ncbi:LPXTG cell wall anchor domain-containing protein [Kallipyga gabonensis]|uniref:LPXTG cell wall anchor domain-containing protein n=1 Tax=Kallipyga gabonensis TaxID=1686287 RepID=UPI003B75C78E
MNPENPNQPNPQDPSQPNRPRNPRNSNQSRPQGGTAQGARVGGSPKTGDNIASVAGVGILAAAALYVSRRKNRQHANESK